MWGEGTQYWTRCSIQKHAATRSTVPNMTDTDMEQLANFLGHDIRIHHEFYILPEKTLQPTSQLSTDGSWQLQKIGQWLRLPCSGGLTLLSQSMTSWCGIWNMVIWTLWCNIRRLIRVFKIKLWKKKKGRTNQESQCFMQWLYLKKQFKIMNHRITFVVKLSILWEKYTP